MDVADHHRWDWQRMSEMSETSEASNDIGGTSSYGSSAVAPAHTPSQCVPDCLGPWYCADSGHMHGRSLAACIAFVSSRW